MEHSPGFLNIAEKAKKNISQVTIDEVVAKRSHGEIFHFVDVREDDEFRAGRAVGAVHLGKGVIERDIETTIPDKKAPIILYCGGGFRSALAADSLQKMGYVNVASMDGGYREWLEKGLPTEK
ncbi:rhodanese-like domain-containing protein [Granulicella sp. S190]|uniref:rhodanese-like domain-containing protein n=1 Tax=Granulicella sp. S190 TaxID=1747226 RepID=UPI00131B4508|nr:rhodanese-like domain-containing protein [Granulicella sp. S190]